MYVKWPTNGISGHRWQTARITPNNRSIGAFRPLFILRSDSSVDTALTIKDHIVAIVSHWRSTQLLRRTIEKHIVDSAAAERALALAHSRESYMN